MVFLGFLVVILLFCLLVGPEEDQADAFYKGGPSGLFGSVLALAGVCLPAATVLGTTGTISLFGYDGMFIALSTLLSLALLLVLAGPLRRHGRFTVGDVFARRDWGRGPRIAAGVATLAVCLPLLTFELASIGLSAGLLLGLTGSGAQAVATVMIGILIVSATVFGGMRCATALQIIKGVLLFAACAVVVVLVLQEFHFDPGGLLRTAQSQSGRPDAFLSQGLGREAGVSPALGVVDFVGLQLTIVLGIAAMPHVVMRVNTLPDVASATVAVRRVMHIMAAFVVLAVVMGLGRRPSSAAHRLRQPIPAEPARCRCSPQAWRVGHRRPAGPRCSSSWRALCSSPCWPRRPASPWQPPQRSPMTSSGGRSVRSGYKEDRRSQRSGGRWRASASSASLWR